VRARSRRAGCDNHALGKIAKEQRAGDFPVWHTDLVNPEWAAYARLCGATGIRVERRDRLDVAMTRRWTRLPRVVRRGRDDRRGRR
jgi:thiamine pyrophosphate-dependent acetolactate synthase large subunit-like protein